MTVCKQTRDARCKLRVRRRTNPTSPTQERSLCLADARPKRVFAQPREFLPRTLFPRPIADIRGAVRRERMLFGFVELAGRVCAFLRRKRMGGRRSHGTRVARRRRRRMTRLLGGLFFRGLPNPFQIRFVGRRLWAAHWFEIGAISICGAFSGVTTRRSRMVFSWLQLLFLLGLGFIAVWLRICHDFDDLHFGFSFR